jgi:hypothetical protein
LVVLKTKRRNEIGIRTVWSRSIRNKLDIVAWVAQTPGTRIRWLAYIDIEKGFSRTLPRGKRWIKSLRE